MMIKDRPEYQSKQKPLSFSPETPVLEAVKAMTKKNFGSVVVVDGDKKVLGIVTERDLMTRLINEERDAKKTKLSDIMTSDIRLAKDTDNLLDWLRIMSNERFRRLPIVDDHGKLVNLMSQGDFVSYTWPELLERLKENTQATFGSNYQIFLILLALLAYSIIMTLII